MSTIRTMSFLVGPAHSRIAIAPVTWVRWSIAVCYLWFGALKYFPGVSPAEALATRTIEDLSLGLISGMPAMVLLATLECVIGLLMLSGMRLQIAIHLLLGHMLCTFAPMVLLPELVFARFPFALTLVGQYIVKNLVIASAAWMILRSKEQVR